MINLDRHGYERCNGYDKKDFALCPNYGCHNGFVGSKVCDVCGGYGEVPIKTLPVTDAIIDKFFNDEGIMSPEHIAALTIWGEVGKESMDTKMVLASIIFNRSIRKSTVTQYPYILEISNVCLHSPDFKSWNNGKFVGKHPCVDDQDWDDCLEAANSIFKESYTPITDATHYFETFTRTDVTHCLDTFTNMKYVGMAGNLFLFVDEEWRG